MGRKISQRTKVIAGSIAIVLLAVLLTVVLVSALKPKEHDPYKQDTPKSQDVSSDKTEDKTPADTQNSDTDKKDTLEAPAMLDPATVNTLDITPLGITVSYVKGIGGFEYEVLRTKNGTQYVEFRSESLIGTKCTDDRGAFASILVDPKEAEAATLAKTVTVDGTKYGLSLPTSGCTSNPDELKTYQASFSDAFTMLKKTN